MTSSGRDPFEELRVPGPPPELERRVLAAAREALDAARAETIWDRLWCSRPLRVAWSVAVLGLLVAHTAVSLRGHARPRGADSRANDPSAELRKAVELPALEISPRAEARVLGVRPQRPGTGARPAKPRRHEEVPS